ncbi:MAG: hypothetical protein PVH50_02465 [Anaerolineae bacterium]
MAYDYRDMTPEERAAVIDERRRRGYPLHAPPHPYRGPGWYCITAANYEHAAVMSFPPRLGTFADRLLSDLGHAGAELGGWVVLTNHGKKPGCPTACCGDEWPADVHSP